MPFFPLNHTFEENTKKKKKATATNKMVKHINVNFVSI